MLLLQMRRCPVDLSAQRLSLPRACSGLRAARCLRVNAGTIDGSNGNEPISWGRLRTTQLALRHRALRNWGGMDGVDTRLVLLKYAADRNAVDSQL